MKKYEVKNWTMNDIAHAMKGCDEQGRRIVIPMFQRGKRWNSQRRNAFIDSLLKGFPVGTLLFADLGNKTYSVIDGLQRSSTVCEYILYPTRRENLKNVEEQVLESCRLAIFPDSINVTIDRQINEVILSFIEKKASFDKVQSYAIAMELVRNFPSSQDPMTLIPKLGGILDAWFNEYKKEFDSIRQTEIPVIIYSGDNIYLNEIFRRINEQGEKLDDYEVYAATWSTKKFKINKNEIIDYVIKKYATLTVDDYIIYEYDSELVRKNKELTVFEFLFGLGKYLINTYDFLNLDSNKSDDKVSAIGFELIDVCINNSKRIAYLAEDIISRNININLLLRRIEESILFVQDAISAICTFKGNQRTKQYLHPKYLILSLIAFVFHEMYDLSAMENKKPSWASMEKKIKKSILHHYVFELICNEWHDGGIGKMYSRVSTRHFLTEYTKEDCLNHLQSYYAGGLTRRQSEKFANPSNIDKLILNCIYADVFTVKDNCNEVYDIEHIATKDIMKRLISENSILAGLPVSHIANLCYLPQSINRGKKAKTIYEDTNITDKIPEIENKYSFTQVNDLDFLYKNYSELELGLLEKDFQEYLKNRFEKQKVKILHFLDI